MFREENIVRPNRISRVLAGLAIALALAGSASASDGVLEINQTCAIETGCFPGDAPGFPVSIQAPGSYRLTSNLALDLNFVQDTPDGIVISGGKVTIDLNGFAISCQKDLLPSGTAPCSNGSGDGIAATGANEGIIVRNGRIEGFPFYGVFVNRACQIEGITVQNNGLRGISTSGDCLVRDNVVVGNGTMGIYAGSNSIVTGNTSNSNGGDGIDVASGSLVQGNVVRGNGGFGIDLTSTSAGYRANVVEGNASGTVDGGTNMGGNVCNGSLSC